MKRPRQHYFILAENDLSHVSVVKRTTQVKNASQAQAPPVSPETPTSAVPTAADMLAPLGALKQGLVQPSAG